MADFRVFIPTRDSTRWVGVFHDAWRRLGVSPLYIVDARSIDGTLEFLRARGAEAIPFEPSADFAEAGMVQFAGASAKEPWLLRMDDDEMPVRALLDWVAREGVRSDQPGFFLSRRELIRHDGQIWYSRRKTAFGHPQRPDFLSGQARLFQLARVSYHSQVHTSGFENLDGFGFAPPDLFFAHFVDLLLSPAQRLEKIRRYEAIEPLSTWRVADEYLPEIFDFATLECRQDGLDEFAELIARLPAPETERAFDIKDAERQLAMQETQRWAAVQAATRRDWTPNGLARLVMQRTPRRWWRPIAQVLLTFAKTEGDMRRAGIVLWNVGGAPE